MLDWHEDRYDYPDHMCTTLSFEHQPILPFWSPNTLERTGRIAVLGPSPTIEGQMRGELGWSRGERVIGQVLRRAGIEPEQVTWINVCWCWPSMDQGMSYHQSQDGQGRVKVNRHTRPPNALETAQWHPWVIQALEAADVDYVLLHGGHAKNAWRTDLTIDQVGGGMYLWKNRWMVSVVNHVSAVMRKDSDINETSWNLSIGRFVDNVREGRGLESLGVACVKCYHPVFGYDPDGVGYCREHIAQGLKGRERAIKRELERRTQDQGRLL